MTLNTSQTIEFPCLRRKKSRHSGLWTPQTTRNLYQEYTFFQPTKRASFLPNPIVSHRNPMKGAGFVAEKKYRKRANIPAANLSCSFLEIAIDSPGMLRSFMKCSMRFMRNSIWSSVRSSGDPLRNRTGIGLKTGIFTKRRLGFRNHTFHPTMEEGLGTGWHQHHSRVQHTQSENH